MLMWNNGIMVGCYIGRNADLGVISEWKAQLLKNQNMLSAAHLSSRKCPDFGIHYNGNCSDKITLSKMSLNRHLRHACRLAQFHDRWEAEIKAFMWEEINREIDTNISSETLPWMVERASFHCFELEKNHSSGGNCWVFHTARRQWDIQYMEM